MKRRWLPALLAILVTLCSAANLFAQSSGGLVAHWTFDETTGQTLFDQSGNNHHGTIGMTTGVGHPGVLGNAYLFDGFLSSVVTVPSHSDFLFQGDFAVAGWFKLFGFLADGSGDVLIGQESQNEWTIGINHSNFDLVSFYEHGADVDDIITYPLSPTVVGEWHHFVAQHRAGVHELYLDGQLVRSESQPAPAINSSSQIGIGGEASTPTRAFWGLLDEIYVHDRALTTAEIQALYDEALPTAEAGGPYVVDEGGAVTVTATGADPSGSPLTFAWDLDGDGVFETPGQSVAWSAASHDGPGIFTVAVQVTDDCGLSATDEAAINIVNVAPTATFADDGPVDEGTSFTLSLTGPSDPSDDDTAAGFEYAFDCGAGGGLGAFSATTTAVCPTSDNAVRSVKGQIRDKDGGLTEYTASVTVNNVAPTVDAITVPTDPVDINDQATSSVDVAFSDPAGANDETYTCDFDMDFDGVTVSVDISVPGVTGTACSAPLDYAEPGVYTVKVIVTDKDGGEGMAEATTFIVVYDPDGGFVTGGGWIDSPEGACPSFCDNATGKANFGFVSKYKKGQSTPTGQTEFNFKAGDLNFHSASYDWLVIAGPNAKYKGAGTVNNQGDYGFMLTACDVGVNRNCQSETGDTFRIKIWDTKSTEDESDDEVIYDNKMGEGDDSNAGTVLGGGNIKIHNGSNGNNNVQENAGEPTETLKIAEEVPEAFALAQNYPNPFNPSTEIRFDLPQASPVRLVVYNAMGQEVARLVDQPLHAGTHSVTWDASGLPSGVYLYRLTAGAFIDTKAMTLLK